VVFFSFFFRREESEILSGWGGMRTGGEKGIGTPGNQGNESLWICVSARARARVVGDFSVGTTTDVLGCPNPFFFPRFLRVRYSSSSSKKNPPKNGWEWEDSLALQRVLIRGLRNREGRRNGFRGGANERRQETGSTKRLKQMSLFTPLLFRSWIIEITCDLIRGHAAPSREVILLERGNVDASGCYPI